MELIAGIVVAVVVLTVTYQIGHRNGVAEGLDMAQDISMDPEVNRLIDAAGRIMRLTDRQKAMLMNELKKEIHG